LTGDIEVSSIHRWGRQKKEKGLPAFLLPREEREKLFYQKIHNNERPKKNAATKYSD
jgi:hypothetical protein